MKPEARHLSASACAWRCSLQVLVMPGHQRGRILGPEVCGGCERKREKEGAEQPFRGTWPGISSRRLRPVPARANAFGK